MKESSFSIDRVGAAAGFVFALLFVGVVSVAPHLPAPEHSIAQITRSAQDDRQAILFGTYLEALLTGALLVFGAGVVARLWRAEDRTGGWWLVALVGLAGTTVSLETSSALVAFVRAVEHGVAGNVLWIGYPSGPDGVDIAIPLGVFLLGAGLGARSSRALPRWLAWSALVLSGMFVVGAAGVTGNEVDGGALGVPLFLGYVGMLVWVVGGSVVLWRQPRGVSVDAAAITA
jgi:uncharacterized membrane protein YhaH (DUF805 family)